MPYAIAAKLAHPDRPVIALAGDGAMQINGINGLMSIAEQFEEGIAAGGAEAEGKS